MSISLPLVLVGREMLVRERALGTNLTSDFRQPKIKHSIFVFRIFLFPFLASALHPPPGVSESAGSRFPTAQLVSRGWGLLTIFIFHPFPSSTLIGLR